MIEFRFLLKCAKDMLPILSAILGSPFATMFPPLLKAAVEALQAILRDDWPRVAHHRSEILEGLTLCWCRIEQEQQRSEQLDAILTMIIQTTCLLNSTLAVGLDEDVAGEYGCLVDSEPRLQDLLLIKQF